MIDFEQERMKKVVTDEPLVFIPGLAATNALFAPQIVAFMDQPLMIADTCNADTITGIAEQLLAQAPETFALAGLSMGGYVAMEVARLAPKRVTRLALMSTNARTDSPEQSENRHKQIRIAQDGGYDKIVPGLYPNWVHPHRHDDSELKQTVIDMAQEVGAEAFIRQQTAMLTRIDQRENLKAVNCPALVLIGDSDQITPMERAEEMHAALPNSELVTVPECGHLATLEQPRATISALQAWMLRG
ncbi:alpha/beta fold hydrolase [Pseudovibrio exalbescens]|uniref:alpha/beta fold hydrolase n=1 Tax=Pseudovibrio exalbescens TaxID=197461 RepID=UPI001AD8F6F6|nr:alpha/beta hydrolase [Pseudovibrio exalbescens]